MIHISNLKELELCNFNNNFLIGILEDAKDIITSNVRKALCTSINLAFERKGFYIKILNSFESDFEFIFKCFLKHKPNETKCRFWFDLDSIASKQKRLEILNKMIEEIKQREQ